MTTCVGCGTSLESGAHFCSSCGRAVQPRTFDLEARLGAERLLRPRQHRMIAGVCAGCAQRYGWDASLVRLVMLLAFVFGAGTPLLAYAVAWVIMPNEPLALPSRTGVAGEAGPGSIAR